MATETRLTAADLRRLPSPADTPPDCDCTALHAPGWESITGPLGENTGAPRLVKLGTLRDPDEAEPTVAEFHAEGSRYESPHAPIAPAFFPYNRCEVWACAACGRGFLQYTEFGGYYVDHRLREIDPARVVDATP
ncbi:hypothetical protein [Rubrivivax rivuli]|uniref:Uncharacterized protein n=1 Tax=Rubrivivax rivuli TaxID=1862385 RepID=A0A437RRK8_9BURK|nr:hypothetical protein [Rubrivivax rivuli]RVU49311.1 hypothetical protein EOE66_01695 [Rubrivivax rivuli]